ncbi:MAG: anti-sigma F factor [Clostridiales bacterium]|nr:anti-sigma F factor [Clostridiales bacterium]
MKKINEMKLEFISNSVNESFARMAVAAFASQLDPTVEEITDIKTAVSEAVTNAIIHGYDGVKGIVTVICELYIDKIVIEVIDTGRGIADIDTARQPLYTTKPNDGRSGMGFTVMETFMSGCEVYSLVGSGTRVRMTKNITGGC